METTLEPDQYVLVDKLTPRFSDYKRGDIIVFTPPPRAAFEGTEKFIKRVIAVGGETVSIHDGHVYVNGVQLNEPYLAEGVETTVSGGGAQTWTIPQGQLFVLGDNRTYSQDSRAWGPIEKSSVIGRAWFRYWPLTAFGPLPGVSYPELIPSASPSAPAPSPPSPSPSHARSAVPSPSR